MILIHDYITIRTVRGAAHTVGTMSVEADGFLPDSVVVPLTTHSGVTAGILSGMQFEASILKSTWVFNSILFNVALLVMITFYAYPFIFPGSTSAPDTAHTVGPTKAVSSNMVVAESIAPITIVTSEQEEGELDQCSMSKVKTSASDTESAIDGKVGGCMLI